MVEAVICAKCECMTFTKILMTDAEPQGWWCWTCIQEYCNENGIEIPPEVTEKMNALLEAPADQDEGDDDIDDEIIDPEDD